MLASLRKDEQFFVDVHQARARRSFHGDVVDADFPCVRAHCRISPLLLPRG
jgi:hypothetical protein